MGEAEREQRIIIEGFSERKKRKKSSLDNYIASEKSSQASFFHPLTTYPRIIYS